MIKLSFKKWIAGLYRVNTVDIFKEKSTLMGVEKVMMSL